MKIKRQFSLLLIFVAICATMTSCGDKQTSTSVEPSNQTEQSTSHQTSEQEEQIKSEIGLTYEHTGTSVVWASEEIKATQLGEMELDENTFFNMYDTAILEVRFLEDNKSIVIYNLGGDGGVSDAYYKNENYVITFYDSLEDMESNNVKTDSGPFAGQFKIANDYKSLSWSVQLEGIVAITLTCTIKK